MKHSIVSRPEPDSFSTHHDAFVRELLLGGPLSAASEQLALSDALTLQADGNHHALHEGLLRGRRIGLMCASDASEDASLFDGAARALGARVSRIPACDDEMGADTRLIAETATLLDRLYDAVECQGIDVAVVRRLAQACSIPVFAGLASRDHPCSALAQRMPGDASMLAKRRWIVQALLLRCIH